MTDYIRADGLTARTDVTTPCRCGQPDCEWTDADDKQRDLIGWADKWGPTLYPDMYPERRNEPAPGPVTAAWEERRALAVD